MAATSASAAATIWMGLFTRRTTVEKIRLDLYDRRFSIYEKTLAFKLLLDNCDENSIKTAEFVDARRAVIKCMREAQFLFKPESRIFERLVELQRASFDIINSREARARKDEPRELAPLLLGKALAAFSLFEESIPFLERAMAPYLNFQDALIVEDRKVEALKSRAWQWLLSDFEDAPGPDQPPPG